MVALRKESVDRNMKKGAKNERTQKSLSARRAWIEITKKPCCAPTAKSLSARRAWIEIVEPTAQALKPQVALRKESVDRNALDGWDDAAAGVALRKESVDRNENAAYIMALQGGRSPQGERG